MCTHSGEPWAPEEAAAADGVGSNEMQERGGEKANWGGGKQRKK